MPGGTTMSWKKNANNTTHKGSHIPRAQPLSFICEQIRVHDNSTSIKGKSMGELTDRSNNIEENTPNAQIKCPSCHCGFTKSPMVTISIN